MQSHWVKAKVIDKYLGNDYLVRSCFSYIRDLLIDNGKCNVLFNDIRKVVDYLDDHEFLFKYIVVDPYSECCN
ncbi:hypothetical protein GN160_00115 [Blochmannia endosymbiont of Colobopsis nipponica]|uniref:hypothetical protein n=1 Tax=Blochmannia endosymbiont of Colobopsis nipponica TaxID=2681987 RepID=UPI00177F0CAA|nr:hypothetical protein [Blochmannia endosymbiont of Colobopsis nipponica]QOI11032.1 hypothetical protein GN160_00115 [Blochmannia endosymbiont of Colobopsis nipponica]